MCKQEKFKPGCQKLAAGPPMAWKSAQMADSDVVMWGLDEK